MRRECRPYAGAADSGVNGEGINQGKELVKRSRRRYM